MKTRNISIAAHFALLTTIFLQPLRAEVTLSGALGSNMVIQRDSPATLWGWADAGEKVTVKLGTRVVAQVEGLGNKTMWRAQLPPQKAGPVADVSISGKSKTITLTNLLAGDVWLCSGQSNMVMTVMNGPWCGYGGVLDAGKEVAASNYPDIRFFTVESNGTGKPQEQVKGKWVVCGPKSLPNASATAYFFGRELHRVLNVPIGLVISAVGGTAVEPWTPMKVLEGDADYAALAAEAKKIQARFGSLAVEDKQLEKDWKMRVAEAEAKKETPPPPPTGKLTAAQTTAFNESRPILSAGGLYNGKIHPLTPMTIAGAIWYQGESNARRGEHYAHSLTKMIEGWRSAFGQPFPVLIVQLANYQTKTIPGALEEDYARLREAQENVARSVPGCGLATAVDIGSATNIHPPNKQEVGRRLAQVALQQVYGRKLLAGGPRYAAARFENGRALVTFAAGAGTLVLKGSGGFEIAGGDRKFFPANAVLKGNAVEVSATSVAKPVAVRYAFQNAPETTLFNADGWPAFPFRSDFWEIK